jgi:hypothetical protein
MRKIDISTDIYARIWTLREEGENSEDEILRRILLPSVKKADATNPHDGFFDRRNNVHFEEGFEIYRTYKGRYFSATASSGSWKLVDGRSFSSLNELSNAIIDGNENAWLNWNYKNRTGHQKKLTELRKPSRLETNSVPIRSTTDQSEVSMKYDSSLMSTWRDFVVEAFKSLGREAHLEEIYATVRTLRRTHNESIPASTDAIVRRELEYNSSDSESFRGRFDLFYSVYGIGGGVWGLRSSRGQLNVDFG